jgi:hypothetical protein
VLVDLIDVVSMFQYLQCVLCVSSMGKRDNTVSAPVLGQASRACGSHDFCLSGFSCINRGWHGGHMGA